MHEFHLVGYTPIEFEEARGNTTEIEDEHVDQRIGDDREGSGSVISVLACQPQRSPIVL